MSDDVRRTRFGRFVARALEDAQSRGMTTLDIEAATKVPSTTYYRWRNGTWTTDPRATRVRDFCAGLGLDPAEAYRALDWSEPGTAPQEPLPLENPLLRQLAHRLADPGVSRDEKALIEETIRMWVARGVTRRGARRA